MTHTNTTAHTALPHRVLERLHARYPGHYRTVLEIARLDPRRAAVVATVRYERPESRAVDVYCNGGGGVRRVYYCPLSGDIIDTESGRHRMTRHAEEAISAHRAHLYTCIDTELVEALERYCATVNAA